MRDEENLLNHLLTKIADAAAPHIVPEVKNVLIKTEETKSKFEDTVVQKTLDEPLPEKTDTIFSDVKPKIKMPEIKAALVPFPTTTDWLENLDGLTEIFIDDNYQSLADDLPDVKPDSLGNINGQTKRFVDNNYQLWADDMSNAEPKNIILEDISDADTVDYTSNIELVKKVPLHHEDIK